MSYNTLADAQAAIDPALTQGQLDSATLYIDARYSASYPGVLADTTQAENWPRTATDGSTLLDINGRELAGIPEQVKAAEVEAARLIFQGNVLLPVTVASATSASTQNAQLIQQTVRSDGEESTRRWSPATSTTSTSSNQVLDSNGLPIISLIDVLMKDITRISRAARKTGYLFNRVGA